jgi:hypothetical protein|nr:MAG TPA: hypothetical protein [Caudoviricetes sp.]
MKQNQTVTLPVLEAKKSTFSVWCEKENQLFSCVLESVVTNRQVCLMAHASLAFSALAGSAFKKLIQKVCGLKNNPHLCSDFHIEQADSTANIAVGIFYAHGLLYSSVPCGALMRPLPVQGGSQRGAELFLFPSRTNQHIVSF